MIKFSSRVSSQTFFLILISFCAVGWQACRPTVAPPPSNNSNSKFSGDVKTFERGVEALVLIDPPPSDGSDGKGLSVENVKSKLEISSLKQAAIVLAPQRYQITVESIDLAIYSGDGKEQLFSLRSLSAADRRTFDPIDKPGSNITGYVFNLDPQRIGEADKFFLPGNIIKLSPNYARDGKIAATLYLVASQSEIIKKN